MLSLPRAAVLLSVAVSVGLSGCMLVFPVPGTGKGCQGESAGFYPAADVVRLKAAREWSCAITGVQVSPRDDTTYDATGCGRREVYICEADAVSGCDLEDASERESCSVPES